MEVNYEEGWGFISVPLIGTLLAFGLIVPIAERMAYNIFLIAIYFYENPDWE